jgi:tRNA-Thr(GGU) m(6)t(6)A37 methyltransferase TsaA
LVTGPKLLTVRHNGKPVDIVAQATKTGFVFVFDRVTGYDLMAAPPSDTRTHGVFATRSPRRPNPIGLTVVKLLRREGPRLHVCGVDMLDGTPVLDIKPYLSSVPLEDLRRGWLAEAEERSRGERR